MCWRCMDRDLIPAPSTQPINGARSEPSQIQTPVCRTWFEGLADDNVDHGAPDVHDAGLDAAAGGDAGHVGPVHIEEVRKAVAQHADRLLGEENAAGDEVAGDGGAGDDGGEALGGAQRCAFALLRQRQTWPPCCGSDLGVIVCGRRGRNSIVGGHQAASGVEAQWAAATRW